MMKIPFIKLSFKGKEMEFIKDAINSNKIAGDGKYTKKCQELMEKKFNTKKIFLTTSCTHALEMSALLLNIKAGDEIILPSFAFVTTANSFVLRGAKPIFVDIRQGTLNIDETLIEEKITKKTKAIVLVHYAGVGCEMDKIMEISKKYNLPVVEDAAQGVNAKYKDKHLGTIGDLGAYSFHETKNYVSGEGGALVINKEDHLERSEIIREKGTNRSKFIRGQIDKYTWIDIGSSYLPSDILAALLLPQLQDMDAILEKRRKIYDYYYENLKELELKGKVVLPAIPKECKSNYHMFYVLLKNENERNRVMSELKKKGIQAVFHYIPLHSSPMGKKYGYKENSLPITESTSKRLLRLPFYNEIKKKELDYVIENLIKAIIK